MLERSPKRKARTDFLTSSLGDPEASSLRTENAPSISYKDFRSYPKRSVCRRINDTETGQREILKMIENLSSKINSLSNKTPSVTNNETTETDLAKSGSSSQQAEMYELPYRDCQHNATAGQYLKGSS